jgi:hypothetical protein
MSSIYEIFRNGQGRPLSDKERESLAKSHTAESALKLEKRSKNNGD